MLNTVFGLLVLSLALATIAPSFNLRHWTIRAPEFPRIQYAVLAGILLLVLLVSRQFLGAPSAWWSVFLVPTLCFQLYRIWPFTPLHAVEVAQARDEHTNGRKARVSVLSSNVLMENREAHRLIELVHSTRPDILITLETDTWWQEQLDAALTDWPHRVACPQDNLYGMHLYSQLPLASVHVNYRVQESIPSITATLDIGPNKQTIQLIAAHPRPPAPGENTRSTERDVELLLIADEIATLDLPVIMAGDLNDTAWSRTTRLFLQVSGLLDPRIGRSPVNTFHADYRLLRWPLDHVFVSPHFRLVRFQRMSHIGSDHFPVFAELELETLTPGSELKRSEDIDRELELDTRDTAVANDLENSLMQDSGETTHPSA